MSLPFARSERSLQKDDYRTAFICSLIILPLFLAWLIWFFTGDLPIYSVSQHVLPGREDTWIANFELEDHPDIQPGDPLNLRLKMLDSDEVVTLQAVLTDLWARDDGSYDLGLGFSAESTSISELIDTLSHIELDFDNQSPFDYLLQLDDDL